MVPGHDHPWLTGKERSFVGPKVYWLEAYAKWADTDEPNEMWSNRPVGQLEKCAEAGALRRAFPEEIGNALTAEEMEGQHALDGAAPPRTSRSRKASHLRVPEGRASLSRRSCRNHSPSPHRHRPSFPNRSPKTIPKSPMPSRMRLNVDDIELIVGPLGQPTEHQRMTRINREHPLGNDSVSI